LRGFVGVGSSLVSGFVRVLDAQKCKMQD